MRRKQPGDTLIEIMFAFAILSTIASVTFAGALSSYRASINAQWRTEATFIAQYQAEALLAYRRSLTWNVFIDGSNLQRQAVDALPTDPFCMKSFPPSGSTLTSWRITKGITGSGDCALLAKELLKNVTNPSIKIVITKQQDEQGQIDDSKRLATIEVSWTSNNGQTETVKNLLLLTKEQ